MINQEQKKNIIKIFGKSANDVGSCEVQIGLCSERIRQISSHLKASAKDFQSQRGLLMLVGRRRTFLNYLKKNDAPGYQKVVNKLKEHGYM